VIPLLASTADWHHHGWLWIWPLMWLLFLSLLAVLVFRRGGRGRWPTAPAAPDPRAILAERYARGEIDHDEYRERLRHLEPR
jgi:putative membrane protein